MCNILTGVEDCAFRSTWQSTSEAKLSCTNNLYMLFVDFLCKKKTLGAKSFPKPMSQTCLSQINFYLTFNKVIQDLCYSTELPSEQAKNASIFTAGDINGRCYRFPSASASFVQRNNLIGHPRLSRVLLESFFHRDDEVVSGNCPTSAIENNS